MPRVTISIEQDNKNLVRPNIIFSVDDALTIFGNKAQGVHSLLYFAYMCVWDLFIGGVIYLAEKIIR